MTNDWDMSSHSSVCVAPLKIVKGRSRSPSNTSAHSRTVSERSQEACTLQSQLQRTPSVNPNEYSEVLLQQVEPTQSVFHTYLRAFYPFHPAITEPSSTVTLPLDEGDIILVHSVHTNGWADGTLLNSGARGWLPTNYCQIYDHGQIRNLLKALINFWDFIQEDNGMNLEIFSNQDYMRGIIAGVRCLLETSSCLTRESVTVQGHSGLRRNRKALLSELSSLVKSAKRLQGITVGSILTETAINDNFNAMLLKAFKVVTRAVKFLDIWNEDIGSRLLMEALSEVRENAGMDAILTPPSDSDLVVYDNQPEENVRPLTETTLLYTPSASSANRVDALQSSVAFASSDRGQTSTLSCKIEAGTISLHIPSSQVSTSTSCQTLSQRQFIQHERSISHRLSYTGQTNVTQSFNLASDRLAASHDAFLGLLGVFIGLHMQSRSSTELFATTQQSVKSCRDLLVVVETVWNRDLQRSEALEQAREAMYINITDLVQAAREAFQPVTAEDAERILMPGEGNNLVDAATACVRAAGVCVAKTRFVIEKIGDFEFEHEPIGLGIAISNVPSSLIGVAQNIQSVDERKTMEVLPPSPLEPVNQPPPPPLRIPKSQPATLGPFTIPNHTTYPVSKTVPDSASSVSTQLSRRSLLPPLPHFASPLMSHDDYSPSDTSSNPDCDPKATHEKASRTDSIGVGSTGTNSTYTCSFGDSAVSILSQTSTRATSPDLATQASGTFSLNIDFDFSGSQVTLAECEEKEAQLLEKNFAHELIYNKDGQISGGTLPALIERLTTHDTTPDAMFVSTFYLTFRLFASPKEFAQALIDRFEYVSGSPTVAGPVRLRVYNVFKGWLESHWRNDCDFGAKDLISSFASQKLNYCLPTAGKRLVELLEKVSVVDGPLVPRLVSSIGKTNTSIIQYIAPDTPLPAPIISRSQLNALRGWKAGFNSPSILDFEPLELARQLTIKESKVFCSILPEELLATEWMKKDSKIAVNVRAMSTLSTDLANLVADSILHLEDAKKRAAIIKQWVKVASKCTELNNYDSLMAIICSLNSSTILRLKRTWDFVSGKTQRCLEELRAVVEVSRNYAILRQRLQNHVPPCLPFVGTYLTDLTFVDVGNQSTRQLAREGMIEGISVINFDKHMKTARIIGELQRFQIPYRLTAVPELQEWIEAQIIRVRNSDEANVQNYYRRSLLLEPREQATQALRPSPVQTQQSFTSTISTTMDATKDKLDFLNWTHHSKERSNTAELA